MKTAVTRFIEEIESAFHRRAFGEERARVNLLPAEQRRAYFVRVRRRASKAHRPWTLEPTIAAPGSGLPLGEVLEMPSVRPRRRER